MDINSGGDNLNKDDVMNTEETTVKEKIEDNEDYNKMNKIFEGDEPEDVDSYCGLTQTNEVGLVKKGRMSTLAVCLFAFFVPFTIMLIAFASIKLFPFGGKQIMVIDSWHQYYPFLSELQKKLTEGGSIFYSWTTGGGTNFYTLISYYAASPVYLLSVLFPQEYLREFLMLATLLKIGASGLFFSIYLRGMFKRSDISVVAFSTLYALSAYALGYYWCVMWLDGMALLPLIMLGFNKLLDENKFKLYVISLGIALFSNYYIGYFICEFIVLYYIVLYISKFRDQKKYHFTKTTVKVTLYSLLGVALSAIMLLPAYLGLQLTANSVSTFPSGTSAYNSLLDILTNLLANTTPAIRAGLPNIACGILALIFAILFFTCNKFSKREKLAYGGLLLALLFCFNVNILDYIFHGFHFPNEIPYRYAFVFSFLLVHMAYKAYIHIDDIKIKSIAIATGALFAFMVLAEGWYFESEKFIFDVFYISMLILLVYAGFILMYKYKKLNIKFLSVFIFFIVIIEASIGALKGAETTGSSTRDGYPPYKDEIQAAVSEIYARDDDFYRLEMRNWYSTNDPVLYGYRGISQFSSEANSNLTRMLELMGLSSSPGSNRYLYSLASPLVNSLLSIKYIMTRDGFFESILFEEIYSNEVVTAYENKYWLPLGFMMKTDIENWDMKQTNMFILQNDFFKKASGVNQDIFRSMYPATIDEDNMTATRSQYGEYYYKRINTSVKSVYKQKYINDRDQHVYLYIKTPRTKDVWVSVLGSSNKYEANRGITIDCGYLKKDQEINVTIDVEDGESGNIYIYAAGFNEEVYSRGYEYFNSQAMQVTEFSDTKVTGTVTVLEDGYLFTSIPYEKGWTVKVDGKKVDVSAVPFNEALDIDGEMQPTGENGAFILVPLTAGEHTLEFTFIPNGFIPGTIITILSIIIIIALSIIQRRYKNKEPLTAESLEIPELEAVEMPELVQNTGTESAEKLNNG